MNKKLKIIVKDIFYFFCSSNEKKIRSSIEKADVVSFDLFDTLLIRKVYSPEQIFAYMEEKYLSNSKYRKINFANKRVDAEKKARNIKGDEEITIWDIYALMGELDENEKEELINYELITEKELISVNKSMLSLYSYACEQGKRVFFISDMYLSKEQISSILTANGITQGTLVVSSEKGYTKKKGNLFEFIRNTYELNGLEWVHIGDSILRDYFMPMKYKIHSKLINPHISSKYYIYSKNDSMEYFKLQSFIFAEMGGDLVTFEDIGYAVFGPLLYAFSLFLDKNTSNEDTILFLAREGKIIEKAFNIISDKKTKYIYVSRRALNNATFHKSNSAEDILKYQINTTHRNPKNIEYVEMLGLDAESCGIKLIDNGINPDAILEDKRKILDLFYQDILLNSKKQYQLLTLYLGFLKFSESTVLVDVGWMGTIQMCFEKLIENTCYGITHRFRGIYFGVKSPKNSEYDKLERLGYLYNCNSNAYIKRVLDFTLPFFELFFLTTEGTTVGYKLAENNSVTPIVNDFENDANINIIQNMQNSALQFVRDMYEFNKCSYINFSPEVAFENYRRLASNPKKCIMEKFKSFLYYDGENIPFISRRSIWYYALHLRMFKNDFVKNRCKIWYLKSILKIPLPYDKILFYLKKFDKNGE